MAESTDHCVNTSSLTAPTLTAMTHALLHPSARLVCQQTFHHGMQCFYFLMAAMLMFPEQHFPPLIQLTSPETAHHTDAQSAACVCSVRITRPVQLCFCTDLYEMASRATEVCNGVVILIADNDEAGISCTQLLDHALHLGMHPVLGGNHDDGHILINQGQGAVLHFASQDALAVHQGHLLHLHMWAKQACHDHAAIAAPDPVALVQGATQVVLLQL